MDTKLKIATLFMSIVERMARQYGAPLPNRLLSIGSPDDGWGVTLNATADTLDDVEPFNSTVTWNGFPAGIVAPNGGVLAAGSLANEAALCEWLESDKESANA